MRQHQAGEHELLDLYGLQLAKQTLGPAYCNLFVFRVWLASKIEISRKVDDGGDAAAVTLANPSQALPNALVRSKVDLLENRCRGRRLGA